MFLEPMNAHFSGSKAEHKVLKNFEKWKKWAVNDEQFMSSIPGQNFNEENSASKSTKNANSHQLMDKLRSTWYKNDHEDNDESLSASQSQAEAHAPGARRLNWYPPSFLRHHVVHRHVNAKSNSVQTQQEKDLLDSIESGKLLQQNSQDKKSPITAVENTGKDSSKIESDDSSHLKPNSTELNIILDELFNDNKKEANEKTSLAMRAIVDSFKAEDEENVIKQESKIEDVSANEVAIGDTTADENNDAAVISVQAKESIIAAHINTDSDVSNIEEVAVDAEDSNGMSEETEEVDSESSNDINLASDISNVHEVVVAERSDGVSDKKEANSVSNADIIVSDSSNAESVSVVNTAVSDASADEEILVGLENILEKDVVDNNKNMVETTKAIDDLSVMNNEMKEEIGEMLVEEEDQLKVATNTNEILAEKADIKQMKGMMEDLSEMDKTLEIDSKNESNLQNEEQSANVKTEKHKNPIIQKLNIYALKSNINKKTIKGLLDGILFHKKSGNAVVLKMPSTSDSFGLNIKSDDEILNEYASTMPVVSEIILPKSEIPSIRQRAIENMENSFMTALEDEYERRDSEMSEKRLETQLLDWHSRLAKEGLLSEAGMHFQKFHNALVGVNVGKVVKKSAVDDALAIGDQLMANSAVMDDNSDTLLMLLDLLDVDDTKK